MKAYQPYVDSLEVLISEAASASLCDERLSEFLAGDTSCTELRRLITLNAMRESGVFFTHKNLSRFALAPIFKTINGSSKILDPACGSGNLLAECTRYLPVESNLKATLALWGDHVIGRDLYKEFISATKGRLILEAVRRGVKLDGLLPKIRLGLFPEIRAASIFNSESAFESATHVVMNPPYTVVEAPIDCEWATGKVSSAALFVEQCTKQSMPSTHVVAILPDVLRSGSRYEKWRSLVQRNAEIRSVRTYGQFDKLTDVHVFVLQLSIRNRKKDRTTPSAKWISTRSESKRVEDYFEVSVGPVVDYRDPHKGSWRPFLKARNLPRWGTMTKAESNRRFKGKAIQPPFVVVRRTSRPEDANRAIGTIINEDRPIAVENHLLVLQPRDRKIELLPPIEC